MHAAARLGCFYNLCRNNHISDALPCLHWSSGVKLPCSVQGHLVVLRRISDLADQAGRRSVSFFFISSLLLSAFRRPTVGGRSFLVVSLQHDHGTVCHTMSYR